MGVKGLADLVLQEATLSAAMADARDGLVPALDLTAPSALRPFVVRGLVGAGRTVLAVAATAREAEGLVASLGRVMGPAQVGSDPGWGARAHQPRSPPTDNRGPPAAGAPR